MKERIGIFPGSFDPITLGHIDLIRRAAEMVDILYVGILVNPAKKSLFSEAERVRMTEHALGGLPGVRVVSFGGLVVDFCREIHATVMFRGLRNASDFEYELELAQGNRILNRGVDTVFLACEPSTGYISSSAARNIAAFGGDVSAYVTPEVGALLHSRLFKQGKE